MDPDPIGSALPLHLKNFATNGPDPDMDPELSEVQIRIRTGSTTMDKRDSRAVNIIFRGYT